MDASTKLTRLAVAAVLSLTLSAAPALAADAAPAAPAEVAVAEETGEEGSGKIQVAETPRDRVGLILFAALGLMTAGAVVTIWRQLRGTRPQADGEFRWR